VQRFFNGFEGKVWTPNLTWPIHNTMAKTMGLEVCNYHYYDIEKREFDSRRYIESLKSIPVNSFVVLQTNGHNPTGHEITNKEWVEVAEIAKERKFLVLMDTAYHGLVTGILDKDAYPVRLMATKKVSVMVAQSYAKNMGLYGQRTGCLSVICENETIAKRMTDFFGQRNRNVFSNPPRFGSDVARTILQTRSLRSTWENEVSLMARNLHFSKMNLYRELKDNKCPGNWEYIPNQYGMFIFTHIKASQCIELREKYSIYMTENGRISVSGLNTYNFKYVANAITEVMKKV
jgi:aspartate/tyrosine/aromatic aminotransferase